MKARATRGDGTHFTERPRALVRRDNRRRNRAARRARRRNRRP